MLRKKERGVSQGRVEPQAAAETPETKIASLEPSPTNPAHAKVPFQVMDPSMEATLPRRVDYSQPSLERVPLNDIIATQSTVTRSAVGEKLAAGRAPDVTELPVGAHGRMPPNDNVPVVFRDTDGKLYLTGGTHRAVAGWARGDADIQAIVYPTKADAPAAKAAAEPVAPAKDELFDEVLADAREQGFTGSDDELRSLYNEHRKSAEYYLEDAREIDAQENPGGRGLFEAIAKAGGIRLDPRDPFHGEIAALWEATEKGMTLGGHGKTKMRLATQLRPTADLGGVPHVLRRGTGQASGPGRGGGLSLDLIREALEQDPRWQGKLPDINALLNLLDDEVRAYRNGPTGGMTLEGAMRGSGLELGKPWWKEGGDASFDTQALDRAGADAWADDSLRELERDAPGAGVVRASQAAKGLPDIEQRPDPLADLLDTGEAQPRLPGDVGNVREQNVATPEFEAPFSLTPEVGTRGSVQPSLMDAPAKTPETLESVLDFPEPRHDVKKPENVAALVASMKQHGWQGRPVLVVRDGGTSVAWTATHRLEAAKQAGLKPSDVPMTVVDGAKLREAGFDLDDITSKGKSKRIEALRAIGEDEAANLLEAEKTGSPERLNAPEKAADVEPVPPNVADFLVKRLNYTPEEVEAMGAKAAVALGNKVRMHPGGAAEGIKALAKSKPEPVRSSSPSPDLGETGKGAVRVESDELANLLGMQPKRQALMRQRVPAESVDTPVEREGAGPAVKTAAQRQAAGESLTTKERQELGLPEEKPATAPVKSQSEVALAKSAMTANARKMAKLLENPTPENLDEYTRLLGEQADRQAQREFKGGTSKDDTLKQHERTGEYLASGLGGLEKLYRENPAQFWTLMRMAGGGLIGALSNEEDPLAGAIFGAGVGGALSPRLFKALAAKAPGVAKALKETLPPSIGGKAGAPIGKAPVRAPRDLTKDISGLEARVYGQPHRTVPDVWKEISPALEELAASERGSPSTTPRMFQFTRNLYLREVLATIDRAARQATENKLPRRAAYLEQMAGELRGVPTVIERFVSDVTNGKIKPKDAKKALGRIENALYLNLLGAAIDTAMTNRTQVLLAMPHVGAANLAKGVRAAGTAEGQGMTQHLNLEGPSDQPGPLARVSNRTVRKVIDYVMSPLRASDVRNRKDVYMSAIIATRQQGLTPAEAHEWAMEITAQTQGTPGELGNNPFHRHLGPLRMFTKYPAVWAQWLTDIATHPDPGVRRRGMGYFLGFSAVGAVTGINVMNLLFPRLMPGAAAYDATKDLVSHLPGLNKLTGPADHTLSEDLDPRRGGKAAIGRYPAKVWKEAEHFANPKGGERFGTHVERTPEGAIRSEHSAWDGFLSLLGQSSQKKADDQDAINDAYTWIADRQRTDNIASRMSKQELQDAIEGGDREAAAKAAAKLTPDQRRAFYQKRNKDVYRRMLERVPRRHRAEFEREFQGRIPRGQ